MKTEHYLEIGAKVSVNFHNSQYTLCNEAEVLHAPTGPGESWVIKDAKNGVIHYISEGVTLTKKITP